TRGDLEKIGGWARALSNHANEVRDQLMAKDQALAGVIELAFKALTDTDKEGRAVRRPQTIEQLLRVLEPTPLSRADDGTLSLGETLSPADTCTNLYSVLDAFRHPDCGFIAPLLPQEFAANAVVDIGHEALIRRWDRLIHQGWLEEEARDGQRYRAL